MNETGETDLVIFVEDDLDTQRLVKWVLESTKRYDVITAKDGVSGLDLVQQHRPALVLLDLDVPLLNGMEVARRILADPDLKQIPLIAVSASVMQQEHQRCLNEGFAAFIEKPFDINSFRQIVDKHIMLRQGARAAPPPAD